MAIRVTCSECGKHLKVAENAAGKRGKCPQCGAAIAIPAVSAPIPVAKASVSAPPVVVMPTRRVEPEEASQQQQVVSTTVNVDAPRRTSSFGVVSLIVGIVAFLVCWIPFVGLLGIPLSALGLLFGGIGLLLALFRKGAGIGFPIAGSSVCVLALVVGISQVLVIGSAGHAAALAIAASSTDDDSRRITDLIQKLKTGSIEDKIAAANALAEYGERAAPAVPQLIQTMNHGQSLFDPVEIAAAQALRRIGRPAALELLNELQRGPSRLSIDRVLNDLAPLVVPELAELSESTDERVRKRTVEALAGGGRDAAPTLGAALRDIEAAVKMAAASSLRELGPDAAGALPELIAAVKRRDLDIIGTVVVILGSIGPAAEDALPALRSLGREENMPAGWTLSDGLREEIKKSIRKIQGQIRNP